MAWEHTREGKFARATGGFVLAGTVAGYFLLPVLRYAQPWLVGVGGSLLAWSVVVLYSQMVEVADAGKRSAVRIAAPFLIGSMFLVIGLIEAAVSAAQAERVCYQIQRELLGEQAPPVTKAGIKLPDAADRFQALGCHYQASRPYSLLMVFERPEVTAAPRR